MVLTLRKPTISFIIFVSLIFVGLICLLGLEAYDNYQKEIERASNDVHNLSLVIDEYTSASFRNIDLAISSIVETAEIDLKKNGQYTLNNIREVLKKTSLKVPEVQGFRLTDTSGNVIAISETPHISFSVSDREYFQFHRDENTPDLLITKPVIGRINKALSLILSHRVNLPNGKFAGIVFTGLKVEHFEKFFSTLNIGSHSVISLWTNDRTLLLRYPPRSELIGQNFPPQPQMQALLDKGITAGTYWVTSQLDETKRIYAYRKNPFFPIMVTIGIADEDFLAKWRQRVVVQMIIVILILTLSIYTIRLYLLSTRQIEAERARTVHAAKMSSLGKMAGGIAHEINNPLMIITGHSEKIAKDIELADLPEELKKDTLNSLNRIETTVVRIADIVRGLLSFSRKGEQDPKTPTSIKRIIVETIALCSEKFQSLGVDIRLNDFADADILCRDSQIMQVLTNLLNNSYDATSILEEKWIETDVQIQNNKIKIRITDSGKGIPKKIALQMMEPFFTTKGYGKGTGLGLSISKEIIEEHGGTLFLDSKSTHTSFVITLPIDS